MTHLVHDRGTHHESSDDQRAAPIAAKIGSRDSFPTSPSTRLMRDLNSSRITMAKQMPDAMGVLQNMREASATATPVFDNLDVCPPRLMIRAFVSYFFIRMVHTEIWIPNSLNRVQQFSWVARGDFTQLAGRAGRSIQGGLRGAVLSNV